MDLSLRRDPDEQTSRTVIRTSPLLSLPSVRCGGGSEKAQVCFVLFRPSQQPKRASISSASCGAWRDCRRIPAAAHARSRAASRPQSRHRTPVCHATRPLAPQLSSHTQNPTPRNSHAAPPPSHHLTSAAGGSLPPQQHHTTTHRFPRELGHTYLTPHVANVATHQEPARRRRPLLPARHILRREYGSARPRRRS